jgi:hypothetical protein
MGKCITVALLVAGTATIAGFGFISCLAAITGLACDFVAVAGAFAGIGFAAGAPFDAVGTGFAAGIVGFAAAIPGFAGAALAGAMVLVAVAGVVFAVGLAFGFAGVCAPSVPHARIATSVAINKRCFSFITVLNYLATGLLVAAAAGSRLK